ncbi:MAG: ATP-binding cassette domain-containing protein [Candidatus Lokiarchaeota archaeon]|nr:ATP-binding cassette domain-containing protein [Candidatus Lokiarchaeota archaeon]MBD3339837.1 ATP-binding cassette domain-containing protein [Candidatus Lokiarchaeota archaeon]
MSDLNLPVISTKNLSYTYSNGTVALKKVNLNIMKGELIGIMGKNGAGKSTLIRTFNGLIKPTQGDIYINGDNTRTKTVAELSKRVGIIFQNPAHQVFSNTVEEEISFSLKSLDISKEALTQRKEEILKNFDLEKYKDRSPLNLSGGETKKLAVASVFCRDPEILVFDEPTLGQDLNEINFFVNLIKREKEKGKTIVIITHNIEFALEYIPRIILMTDGKIVADGPTNKILTNEFLIKLTSLVLPQLFQFYAALKTINIKASERIRSKEEMKDLITTYIERASKKRQGGS